MPPLINGPAANRQAPGDIEPGDTGPGASVLNGASPPEPELSDPLLEQIRNEIERNLALDPQNKANFLKVVVAGLHLALDKGPNSLLAQLRQSRDPIADAAKGAVSLMIVMRKQAKGVMPLKAGIPAAAVLMLHALDFLDRSGTVKIGVPELTRATQIFGDFVFARFGISRQGLQQAAVKVHQIVQDPVAMQKIGLKAGVLRHPDAALPTPGV